MLNQDNQINNINALLVDKEFRANLRANPD